MTYPVRFNESRVAPVCFNKHSSRMFSYQGSQLITNSFMNLISHGFSVAFRAVVDTEAIPLPCSIALKSKPVNSVPIF